MHNLLLHCRVVTDCSEANRPPPSIVRGKDSENREQCICKTPVLHYIMLCRSRTCASAQWHDMAKHNVMTDDSLAYNTAEMPPILHRQMQSYKKKPVRETSMRRRVTKSPSQSSRTPPHLPAHDGAASSHTRTARPQSGADGSAGCARKPSAKPCTYNRMHNPDNPSRKP